jgi:hypothetical protein
MPHSSFAALSDSIAAFCQESTFTVGQAAEHGLSRRRLARAADAGALHRVARGTYALHGEPLDLARHHMGRLQRRGIDAVLGGTSAASIWGVPAFGSDAPLPEPPLTILVPREAGVRQGSRHGLRLRVADLSPTDVTSVAGVPITRPLRTGVDLAREFGRCRASALIPLSGGVRAEAALSLSGDGPVSPHDVTHHLTIDAELRRRLLAELDDVLARVNSRGMAWVRQVIADVEPLLESVLEGIAWSVLTVANLPRPHPQAWVAGRSGRRYRVDFLFDRRVILEADGAVKYADRTPWEEKQRQSDLEAAGYWVVRCSWEEIIHRPHEVIARICLALGRSAL